MARTTNIELKGDRYKARQLSLAHTNRLLEKFRGFNDFNKLMTNSHREDFFDDTGAYIGSIKMQTTFGTEKVIVEVGAGKPRKKPELWREKRRPVDLIVPVMRSTDNHYWVVCLSGTFEPPYLVFENIYNIPAEDFDDNVEIAMDKKLISILPGRELFFIAQTGLRPEEDEYEYFTETDEYSYTLVHTGNSVQICGDIGLTDVNGAGSEMWNTLYKIKTWGQALNIPESASSVINTRARTWIVCSAGAEEVYSVCGEALATATIPGKDEFFRSALISYSEGDSLSISSSYESCSPWAGRYSVRPERESTANFAACYRIRRDVAENTGSRAYNPCAETATDYVNDIIDTSSTTYGDYFKVDGTEYTLREESSGTYPLFYQHGLKYYNTENIAAITALMAAFKWDYVGDTANWSWIYHYVGPNSSDQLVSTTFIPESGVSTHIIPDIGLPVDTLFRGEIFLALLRTTKEDTVQIL